jgi:hypothetical protein
MPSISKRAVVSILTGAVYIYGRSDFTGQFNPSTHTQKNLSDLAVFALGIETYYHKVVGELLLEMTIAEKTAVDTERESIAQSKLDGALRIIRQFPNIAALPNPPPGPGYVVAVANVGGARGLAYSTNTGWSLYQQTGSV